MLVSYNDTVRDNAFKLVPFDEIMKKMKADESIKKSIEYIRDIKDHQQRQEKKRELLPHFNPSIFKDNIRKNENLQSAQFLIFDFDNLTEQERDAVNNRLRHDNRTYLLFQSASGGTNLKAIFKLNKPLNNQKAFEAVFLCYHNLLQKNLGVKIDENNKNSHVGTYLTYDPNLYYNSDCQTLSTDLEFQFRERNIPSNGEYTDLTNLPEAAKFLKGKIDCYTEFCQVLYSLASIGEKGREYFIDICAENPDYPMDVPEKLSKDFDSALKTYNLGKENRIRINSLFYLAQKKGFVIPKRSFEYSEMGMAERIAYHFSDRIKYCHDFKKWYIWDGRRFESDKVYLIADYYNKAVEMCRTEIMLINDSKIKEAAEKYLKSCRGRRMRDNILNLLQSETKIRIKSEELDADTSLFNCANGIMQLSKGEISLTEHTPEFLLTKISEAKYNYNAECPKWLNNLNKTFSGNIEMIRFIQRAVGYSLTCETGEEVLFFMHGAGANGKSVFIEVLKMLMGEYFQRTQIESFLKNDKAAGQPNPELIQIKGARLIVGSEIPDNKSFNDKLIKDLTGGDSMTARPLYGDYVDFKPVCKIWLYGNHRPSLKSTDYGIRRRLLLIPFDYTIPPEERRDKAELLEEFRSELPGILNWALDGYCKWYKQKLSPPPEILQATQGYFLDNDNLQSFINDYCRTEKTTSIIAHKFFTEYNNYLRNKEENAIQDKNLCEKLREKGFQVKKGTGNKTYIYGLDLTLTAIAEINSMNIQHDFN